MKSSALTVTYQKVPETLLGCIKMVNSPSAPHVLMALTTIVMVPSTVQILHAQGALLDKALDVAVGQNHRVRREAVQHRLLLVLNGCITQSLCLFYRYVRYRIGVGK